MAELFEELFGSDPDPDSSSFSSSGGARRRRPRTARLAVVSPDSASAKQKQKQNQEDPFEFLFLHSGIVTLDSDASASQKQKQKQKPEEHKTKGIHVLVESPEPQLGIDLAKRGHEVRKLLFAGFSTKMAREGYDPDDVLQEVYRGLLARNQGTCRFDPRKSSFGHYVHMVASCVLSNYHRKDSRRRSFEQLGVTAKDGSQQDAASFPESGMMSRPVPPLHPDAGILLDTLTHAIQDPNASLVLPLLAQGYSRNEIAQATHLPPSAVSKAMTHIRSVATQILL